MAWHTNSEGEKIGVIAGTLRDVIVELLVVCDDPPPEGTGVQAPMLLDVSTRKFLIEQLTARDWSVVKEALDLYDRFARLRLETGFLDDYGCEMTEVRYDCVPEPDGPGGTAGFDPPATSLYNWLAADMRRRPESPRRVG